jgi:hypothetical protein
VVEPNEQGEIDALDLMLAQADGFSGMKELLQSGLLGVLLVIALGVIWKLYNDLTKERDGRLADAKAFTDMVRASTEATTRWTMAQEERNKAMEEMAQALKGLTK